MTQAIVNKLRAGTRAGFRPMPDVTQYWEKPNRLLNIPKGKVKRMFVFGFGHMMDDNRMTVIGRRIVAELPKRFPQLYPPWKPCQVGTYDCLVSHGARITLLLSPNEVRQQHLGPWCLKSMRGVIQGYIDGKRKQIPGTVKDLFGDSPEADETQLAPLDTVLDLTGELETLGAGHETGVQVGLLDPKEVAAVVIHEDVMAEPGVVQVPPWSPGYHEGFNGVVTSFRKGFLTGVRGARITIGVGWPGYTRGDPRPYKPDLIPKMWVHRNNFEPDMFDRAVEATEDQLRKLQIRWNIGLDVKLRDKWQDMPLSCKEMEQEALRKIRHAELEKELCTTLAESKERLEAITVEAVKARRQFLNQSKEEAKKLEKDTDEYRVWRTGRRSQYHKLKSDFTTQLNKLNRRMFVAQRQLKGLIKSPPRTVESTPDRILGAPPARRPKSKAQLRELELRAAAAQGLQAANEYDEEEGDEEEGDEEMDETKKQEREQLEAFQRLWEDVDSDDVEFKRKIKSSMRRS